ncbi:MAG: GNAT family N-acetyltransferase [Acidobacteriia bacterium]|nr:GNAT family N-acetyltransferase [Methyloceanibacter sp.]MCL6491338.1 GNAT family N-acetyltransferase [Terriglobia bacterium]
MHPANWIETARLLLRPVQWDDLKDLQALKADPRVFAQMYGGIRTPQRTAEELAEDMAFWAKYGVGIWTVRDRRSGDFLGIVGLMERPDGLGLALRFALWPEARGRGLAREAAGAALRFAHERAGIPRVIAVAREDNYASRMVLGGIGMVECGRFVRDGHTMLLYESRRLDAL